jgi:L-iditol 2-dehydrogenase
MHVQMSRLAGARAVIVSEPSAPRREQALAMGATEAIDPTAHDVGDVIRARSGGFGADVAIAAIGVPDLVLDLLRWVRPGGRVNLFAGYAGAGEVTMSANLIHYGELVVTGTSACTSEDFRVALGLLSERRVDAGALVSHRFPLAEVHEAFDVTRRGVGLRVVVTPR